MFVDILHRLFVLPLRSCTMSTLLAAKAFRTTTHLLQLLLVQLQCSPQLVAFLLHRLQICSSHGVIVPVLPAVERPEQPLYLYGAPMVHRHLSAFIPRSEKGVDSLATLTSAEHSLDLGRGEAAYPMGKKTGIGDLIKHCFVPSCM
jgi:hypothetical protein